MGVAVKIYPKSILRKIKSIQRSSSHSSSQKFKISTVLQTVASEINVLRKIRHVNLVSLLQIVDSPETNALYIVLEYIPLGQVMTYDSTIGRYLPNSKFTSSSNKMCFDEETTALFFVDVLHGLAYLHVNHICHRDIKPENILLDERGLVKISDFGVSHYFDDEAQDSGVGEEDGGSKSDVSSVGGEEDRRKDGYLDDELTDVEDDVFADNVVMEEENNTTTTPLPPSLPSSINSSNSANETNEDAKKRRKLKRSKLSFSSLFSSTSKTTNRTSLR